MRTLLRLSFWRQTYSMKNFILTQAHVRESSMQWREAIVFNGVEKVVDAFERCGSAPTRSSLVWGEG